MKVNVIQDSVSIDATVQDLKEVIKLLGFFADNNKTIDEAYEYLSSLTRPKIVIRPNFQDGDLD